LTATRFVGLALMGYPAAETWGMARGRRRMGMCLLLGVVACLGIAVFFLWCQEQFGRWDLYLCLNEIGWQTQRDYLAVLKWQSYRPAPLFGPDGAFCPDRLSRNFVPLMAGFFVWLLWREYRGRGFRARAGLYLCAGLLFYLAIGGKAGSNMGSMVRIALPVYVLLVLATVHQFRTAVEGSISRRGKWLLIGLGAGSLLLQAFLAYRFTHRLWVA
jgi:hypothetical protein